jgi:NAD(P)H-hydrate repair Nnr-like enzyme with NAD(P)H-hydrate epimerase domain
MRNHYSVRAAVALVLVSSGLAFFAFTGGGNHGSDQYVMAKLLPEGKQDCREPMVLTQQPLSNICVTAYISCELSQYGAVGAPCWCIGPSGPVKGTLAPVR